MIRCLVVRVPAALPRIEDLMVHDVLIRVHAVLQSNGIPAEIQDMGIPAAYDRQSTASTSSRLIPRFLQWRVGAPEQAIAAWYTPGMADAVQRVHSRGVVAFHTPDREAFLAAVPFAKQIRARHAGVRSVAFGPYASAYSGCIAQHQDGFHGIIVGDPASALLHLSTNEGDWSGVPGMVLRTPSGAFRTAEARSVRVGVAPAILRAPGKLHYCDCSPADSPDTANTGRPNANGVGISACHSGAGLRPQKRLRRAPRGSVSATMRVPEILALGESGLREAGALSVAVRMETGSQRLHDHFFESGIMISRLEEAIHIVRAAGCFTLVELAYPCPLDDFHTRAETLRVLQRTQPHAVRVSLPEITPNSAWYARPSDYGFALRQGRYARVVAGVGLESLPCAFAGWSAARIADAQSSLREAAMALGIQSDVSVQEGFLARISGQAGGEEAFARRCRERLAASAASAQALVDELNDHLATHTEHHAVALPLLQAAVGN